MYECPNCAATFCSYCGSSTILSSRIIKEKRPKYIIPFTQTEDDCREAYRKMIKKASFAPKELKDEAHIQKFRGIYMPYWVYTFAKKGPISFKTNERVRNDDYIVTYHYNVTCDVDDSLYIVDAEKLARDILFEQITKRSGFSQLNLEKVVADLPIDIKKYLRSSLLIAIPLFILLNLFFTFKPDLLLVIVALFTFVCVLISNAQISQLIRRESGEDDRGKQYKEWNARQAEPEGMPSMMDYIPEKAESAVRRVPMKLIRQVIFLVVIFLAMFWVATRTGTLSTEMLLLLPILPILPILIGPLVTFVLKIDLLNASMFDFSNWRQKLPLLLKSLSGIVVAEADTASRRLFRRRTNDESLCT